MKETLGSENSALGRPARSRIDLLDWFKGCAILAVVFDHLKIVPGLYVTWAVNVFVLISGGL